MCAGSLVNRLHHQTERLICKLLIGWIICSLLANYIKSSGWQISSNVSNFEVIPNLTVSHCLNVTLQAALQRKLINLCRTRIIAENVSFGADLTSRFEQIWVE